MDLSSIKMVVTDMDGTLLNGKHEVSPKFFQQFKKLKELGILFIAASGRQYHSIIDKLAPIKKDIIVIAENGGYAAANEEEILSTPLSRKDQKNILETLKNIEDIHPVLCGKNKAYLTNISETFTQKLKEYYTEYEILEHLEEHNGEILKIAIYHFNSSEKFIYPNVKHLEDTLKVKVSGENWLDISSPNANKGFALQHVMNLHHIKPEEVLAFGDYNNDLEMLTLAKHSVAMANAHPNVKNIAAYQTKSNEELGVESILDILIKAKSPFRK